MITFHKIYKAVDQFSIDFGAMSNINIGPHKRLRVYDNSHAEIILRVRQYFEFERNQEKSQNLNRVVERTAAATGTSRKIFLNQD